MRGVVCNMWTNTFNVHMTVKYLNYNRKQLQSSVFVFSSFYSIHMLWNVTIITSSGIYKAFISTKPYYGALASWVLSSICSHFILFIADILSDFVACTCDRYISDTFQVKGDMVIITVVLVFKYTPVVYNVGHDSSCIFRITQLFICFSTLSKIIIKAAFISSMIIKCTVGHL